MRKVLPIFKKLSNIKGIKSKRIIEGISNKNYEIIDENGQKHVLRIAGQYSQTMSFNRYNEQKIISLEKIKKINVPVLNFDVSSGNMITTYIKSNKKVNYMEKTNLLLMVDIIKKVHSIDINNSDIKPFDVFLLINKYQSIVKEKLFARQDEVIIKAKKMYLKYNNVLCHNDLLFSNFLFSKDRVYLLDYEYGGINIELFDVVSFISENNIEDITTQVLILKQFYPVITASLLADINTMFLLQDMLWSYWAYAMYYLYKDIIFLTIGNFKYKRYNARIHTL